jgi:ubiquinone/menaquinone biosynthesis C-methylase UbiE
MISRKGRRDQATKRFRPPQAQLAFARADEKLAVHDIFCRRASDMQRQTMLKRLIPLVRALALLATLAPSSTTLNSAEQISPYSAGPKTRDGIGKYYFGREIAHFMSHEGAPWLDRPERDREERPDLVLAALNLKPGDIVADIGCGTGYFSWRLADPVGPRGKVYGVEIQPEMLEQLALKMKDRRIANVTGVLGAIDDPKLPEPVDLVLMVDVYHEFSRPAEMMAAICRQLKPGGRVVFVEYRGEDPAVPIKPLHKMTEAQVKKEMTALPLEHIATVRTLPRQHLLIFRLKGPSPVR